MAKKRNRSHSNNGNNRAKEKKIEQKLFRLMPALPKLFKRLRNRIENFDWKQPKTFMADLQGEFKAFEQTLQGRERRVWRLLWFLFGKLAVQIQAKQVAHETITTLKRLAAADPRYSLLMKLMRETDKQVPFASLLVFYWHGKQEIAWERQCAPMDLLEQAEQETGEARAKTVLRALPPVAEYLYKPYLYTLWALSYIKEGKHPPQAPEFGEMVKQLHRRLTDYPGLVEPDAGWMRNSAVHNMPEYILKRDAVVMWDRNHPRTEVRVDELLEMVQRMYIISAVTIMYVGQLYMFRDFLVNTGFFGKFMSSIPLVFACDEARLAVLEQELKQLGESLTKPLVTFFSSYGVEQDASGSVPGEGNKS